MHLLLLPYLYHHIFLTIPCNLHNFDKIHHILDNAYISLQMIKGVSIRTGPEDDEQTVSNMAQGATSDSNNPQIVASFISCCALHPEQPQYLSLPPTSQRSRYRIESPEKGQGANLFIRRGSLVNEFVRSLLQHMPTNTLKRFE